ncbi:small integral membrane protein 22 isoform X2 [Paramormyrops kingsleyae]|uniref:small integral membrane protein 22 isoform X2 n=1 Tax=Paramormyrops kingsleyae TaxID=1676925 RepID=UPI000CD627CA|nr:small integral membrane protein 22 isoform X2 [Paramormyrops kingsleyae]
MSEEQMLDSQHTGSVAGPSRTHEHMLTSRRNATCARYSIALRHRRKLTSIETRSLNLITMDLRNDLQNQVNDVISRLSSKQLFQSDWDIAAFAVFFIFIGVVLLLVILVLVRFCCCCCCDAMEKPRRQKVGIENMALEP